jgi:hypothetical protein
MAIRTDFTATAPTGAISDPRQQNFQRSLQNLLGKSVQGEVQSRLSDGSFLVKVAGTSARMMLPAGTQAGTEVKMMLVALTPRPTFQISSGNQALPTLAYSEASAPNELSLLRSQASTRATALAPDLPGTGDEPSLSNAARAIGVVLARTQGASAPQAIIGKTPLIADSVPDPAQLAASLQDTISRSGLFYESHLALWAQGKRSLSELQQEPQMRTAMRSDDGELAAAQLINLQLRTQEQDTVRWQGQAWPGTPMEWEIAKDAPQGGQPDNSPEPTPWRSGMRFQFPLLGEVSASVVLTGSALHIQIQAGSDQSLTALRAEAGALQQSLEAAGMPLASLAIHLQSGAPTSHVSEKTDDVK